MQTTLRFAGDWSAYAGTAIAAALALVMWWLYFRESRVRPDARRWILPTLRALAVFLVAWILVGPVLHHEKVIRELGRLFVFVDSSRSMDLVDKEMPLRRKIASLRSMNMLPDDEVLDAAEEAANQLENNQRLMRVLLDAIEQQQTTQFKDDAGRLLLDIRAAVRKYETFVVRTFASSETEEGRRQNGQSRQQLEVLKRETDGRIVRMERLLKPDEIRAKFWKDELQQMQKMGKSMNESIVQGVEAYAGQSREDAISASIEKFDTMTRWDRAQKLLLDPEVGALREVAKNHDIEFLALRDGEAQPLWWQRRGGKKSSGELPNELVLSANGLRTDLGEALSAALGDETQGAGVLLLTDGQHNALGSSPIALSRLFGENGTPIFSVGVGSTEIPEDMGISTVDGPRSVYADDLIRGDVLLNDRMKPGADYQIQIKIADELVWEQAITSEQSGERRLPFQFPVKQIFDRLKQQTEAATELRNAPLEFDVTVRAANEEVAEREKLADNNHTTLTVQAVTQYRKLLILDGRQRWETRYLRNMFERLPQWEVHSFIDGLAVDNGQAKDKKNKWRTSGRAPFPASREELFQYELIVFGDVPPTLLNDEEVGWIKDLVGKRGGGLIFLDGRRGHLATYAEQAGNGIGDLLPVQFDGDHRRALTSEEPASQLTVTDAGGRLNALRLVGSDEGENSATWRELPSPRWIAPAVALPGALTYLESPDDEGRVRPVLALRPFGAGRVLYAGSDEFWRWRYNVGDRFHQKFWMQIANWISYPPYSVDGEFVSLGTDQSVYDPNSSVAFHVALRDDDGKPITDPDTELSAILYRDDRVVGEVKLEDDGNESGIFRGRSDKLTAGRYQIRVRGKREYEATAELVVKDTANREIVELSLNRDLLQSMALYSGGEYFDEEQLGGLSSVINRMDQKKVISSETSLWDSWWWFVPVMVLLTIEWWLRKKSGMV